VLYAARGLTDVEIAARLDTALEVARGGEDGSGWLEVAPGRPRTSVTVVRV
jgi:hypothetical protein